MKGCLGQMYALTAQKSAQISLSVACVHGLQQCMWLARAPVHNAAVGRGGTAASQRSSTSKMIC